MSRLPIETTIEVLVAHAGDQLGAALAGLFDVVTDRGHRASVVILLAQTANTVDLDVAEHIFAAIDKVHEADARALQAADAAARRQRHEKIRDRVAVALEETGGQLDPEGSRRDWLAVRLGLSRTDVARALNQLGARSCDACGSGERRPGSRAKLVERDGRIVVVHDVPVVSCDSCGETWLTNDTAIELDRIVQPLLASPAAISHVHWDQTKEL